MTISKPNLVRLIAAVIGAAASAWFVVHYTEFSRYRFEFEHRGGQLINANVALVAYGRWLYLLPVMALILGFWLLRARPDSAATFEALVAVTWLLTFAVAAFTVLLWQVQNVPTFSHMEWHF
jgi:TRAP-type uncharacterized transport system fused permease subunit